jgi:uncharacterized iron-regulated protein
MSHPLLRPPLVLLCSLSLAACSLFPEAHRTPTPEQLAPLMDAEILLLGEQHDAPDHQRIERELLMALIARVKLAALALEMAPQGGSTAGLAVDAGEDAVRNALQLNEKEWPWKVYGPAAMVAVRAGVPVLGANLPASKRIAVMEDRELDTLLKGPALKAQQQNIRLGHCSKLPESQIGPMTRIQIARDQTMARTLMQARVPAKLVLLLAGAQHVDKNLGVPQHLNSDARTVAIGLLARKEMESDRNAAKFDVMWSAIPAPEKDYCAEFKPRKAS